MVHTTHGRQLWGLLSLSALALWLSTATGSQHSPEVCFIVRTYRGHEDKGDPNELHSLSRFLTSLTQQDDPRWEAHLVVLDEKPFLRLFRVLQRFKDPRIHVFAEWVGQSHKAKEPSGDWKSNYHVNLYNLTDLAIRMACQSTTPWVVVTNGDNEHSPQFVSAITNTPSSYDAVAVDYYSRYQRPTHAPCERFAAGPASPPCKVNEMRVCHMDTAAVAWKRQKLISEDRTFATVDSSGSGVSADGMMAERVVEAGWKVFHHKGRCLVHHSPNAQQCAQDNRVWDDTGMDEIATLGGVCRTAQEMAEIIAPDRDAYELMNISASFDPGSFGLDSQTQLFLACVRRKDSSTWTNRHVFGRVCAARDDYHSLPLDMPVHAWDAWVPDELKQIEADRRAGKHVAPGTQDHSFADGGSQTQAATDKLEL